MRSSGSLQHRRQPDGSEADFTKFVSLRRQMIPPPRHPGLAIRRRRHSAIGRELVKPLKHYSHGNPLVLKRCAARPHAVQQKIAAAASKLLLFAFDVRETEPLSTCQSTRQKINHVAGRLM